MSLASSTQEVPQLKRPFPNHHLLHWRGYPEKSLSILLLCFCWQKLPRVLHADVRYVRCARVEPRGLLHAKEVLSQWPIASLQCFIVGAAEQSEIFQCLVSNCLLFWNRLETLGQNHRLMHNTNKHLNLSAGFSAGTNFKLFTEQCWLWKLCTYRRPHYGAAKLKLENAWAPWGPETACHWCWWKYRKSRLRRGIIGTK